MIPLSPSTRIYLACGATDMRKGFDGLVVLAQQVLHKWLLATHLMAASKKGMA